MGNILNNNNKKQIQRHYHKAGVNCSAPVEVILKAQLKKMFPLKQMIYDNAISQLNENDKKQVMTYIKCNDQLILPQQINFNLKINIVDGSYNYQQAIDNTIKQQWFVNFSDKNLFGYYHTQLFAQDEIQCVQFPILPHIREYILNNSSESENIYPITRVNYTSYPILVTNCQLLCYMQVSKPCKNFPQGIYGNTFSYTNQNDIEYRTLYPGKNERKTLVNLVCMTALCVKNSEAEYSDIEIFYTFETAFKAFSQAVAESHQINPKAEVIINTGNWGCGAFVQLTAANLAGVSQLNYHPFDDIGKQGLCKAQELYSAFVNYSKAQNFMTTMQYINLFYQFCKDQKFKWGTSNNS